MSSLGGWAITEQVFNLICFLLPDGSRILEFGSGDGTTFLTDSYEMHSIEHDEAYLGHAPHAIYTHAPIIKQPGPPPYTWYDPAKVAAAIPADVDLILIDGPTGVIGREGILHHLHLLDLSKPLLVDDVNRPDERMLALKLADRLGTIPLVFGDQQRQAALLIDLVGLSNVSQKVGDALAQGTHRLRFSRFDSEAEALALKEHLETDFGWLVYSRKVKRNGETIVELVTGIFYGIAATYSRALTLKSDLDCAIEIITEVAIPEAAPPAKQRYVPSERWRQEGRRLILSTPWREVHFDMPEDWKMSQTHPDLFKLTEFVLMHPWEDGILDDWKPSRKPGRRPGLAFSGGIDSAAAMLLMPEDTALVYHERDFDSGMDHTNASRFLQHLEQEGREVWRVQSDHELIRTDHQKGPGFSTDYACGVQVILLADYLDLDSIGTGMPLENAYLYHGQRYRDFGKSWFWRLYGPLFESVGLPIFQPVAGCSEIINQRIVKAHGLEEYAQSCLRSADPGKGCGRCWKCFRKNTMAGQKWVMSNEIDTFLRKSPLKQAASTIYSLQNMAGITGRIPRRLRGYPQVEQFWNLDLSWMDLHLPLALDLIPVKYREDVKSRIEAHAEPMCEPYPIIGFQLDEG